MLAQRDADDHGNATRTRTPEAAMTAPAGGPPSEVAAPRVLFVITTMGVGGAESQVSLVARGLAAKGWVVRILTLRDLPLGRPRSDTGPIETLSLGVSGPLWSVRAMRGVSAEVRRFQADVIVTLLLQANVIGRLVGALLRVPVVSSIRNTRFGGSTRVGSLVGDWLERLTSPAAAVTIMNSERTADALVRRRVVPADRARVIPNTMVHWGFDASPDVRHDIRAELAIDPDAFVWLTAGRLEPQKNHDALLRAFARLHCEFAEVRLLVAGDGSLRSEVERLCAALGVASATTLLGVRSDLPRVMAGADAFVLSSRWEGMPNVVLESMAQGLPTVGTPVGGVPELIEDGVTGWLAASPEADDLHATMRAVMHASPAELRRVGLAARAIVHARHGPDEVIAAWHRTLHDVVVAAADRRRA